MVQKWKKKFLKQCNDHLQFYILHYCASTVPYLRVVNFAWCWMDIYEEIYTFDMCLCL